MLDTAFGLGAASGLWSTDAMTVSQARPVSDSASVAGSGTCADGVALKVKSSIIQRVRSGSMMPLLLVSRSEVMPRKSA